MNYSKANWQRSSYCGAGGNNCLELSSDARAVSLRESESPEAVITAAPAVFGTLVAGIKSGRLPS